VTYVRRHPAHGRAAFSRRANQTRSILGLADRSAWNGYRQNSLIGCGREDFLGAQLVHDSLQIACFCATERTLSDSKQMKSGVYEQGREN
jgi:hypothetical protein